MTPELSTLLALLAGGMVLIAGVAYWWISRTPTVERYENEPLPLFGGLTAEERMRSPAASRPAVPGAPMPRATPATPAAAPRAEPAPPPRPAPVIREFVTSAPSAPREQPPLPKLAPSPAAPPQTAIPQPAAATIAADHAIVSAAGVPGTMVEGHALRFSVPAEGTLQFLPGRLEIGAGLDAGREVRFVRVEGPDGIEVTFGRSEGGLYRHIQLRDKTVSRAHAVMRFRHATWHLQNLSHTNPVVHNGAPMPGNDEQPLADGDRIEMGEVVFTYRAR